MSDPNRRVPWGLKVFMAAALAGGLGLAELPGGDAYAFSRGMAAKVRRMRESAYAERMNAAMDAFKARRFEDCVKEASLALDHASDEPQAAAAHHLLASAHLRLGDTSAAAPHQAWLARRKN